MKPVEEGKILLKKTRVKGMSAYFSLAACVGSDGRTKEPVQFSAINVLITLDSLNFFLCARRPESGRGHYTRAAKHY